MIFEDKSPEVLSKLISFSLCFGSSEECKPLAERRARFAVWGSTRKALRVCWTLFISCGDGVILNWGGREAVTLNLAPGVI